MPAVGLQALSQLGQSLRGLSVPSCKASLQVAGQARLQAVLPSAWHRLLSWVLQRQRLFLLHHQRCSPCMFNDHNLDASSAPSCHFEDAAGHVRRRVLCRLMLPLTAMAGHKSKHSHIHLLA